MGLGEVKKAMLCFSASLDFTKDNLAQTLLSEIFKRVLMIIDESKREASEIYFSVQLKFVVALMGACFWTVFSI